MIELKYIMLDDCFPILFTGAHQHDRVRGDRPVTSAGKFRIKNGNVETYGESFALKMKPATGDDILIQRMLFGE